MARAKNLASEAGRKLDNDCDRAKKVVAFMAVLHNQFYLDKWLLIGLLLVGIHYSQHIIRRYILRRIRILGKKRRNTRFSQWLTGHGLTVTLMETIDEEFLIVVIGPLINQFKLILVTSISLFFIFDTLDLMEFRF